MELANKTVNEKIAWGIETSRQQALAAEIAQLKKDRDAVIFAHCYQRSEVQAVADQVGDSFQLARWAQESTASVIVLAGVRFMAETAKILNPDKKVLLPEVEAGCPMADMVDAKQLAAYLEEHPNTLVVSYINTTAEVKALTDICCTSANARQVVESLPSDQEILFLPDRNLGSFINNKIGSHMKLWPGYCPTHAKLGVDDIKAARKAHPAAEVLVHPECDPEVVKVADQALGTTGMVKHIGASEVKEFIIGTEVGLVERLQMLYPEKSFYLAASELICPNMKATTLSKVRDALLYMEPEVEVLPQIMRDGRAALDKMMNIE
ncbi:MAG: quinolinate synthase NadA [Methylocystaceae bacterium]